MVKNCDNKQLKYNVAHALYYGAYVNFNSQEDGTTFQVPFLKDQRKGFHYFNELSDAGYGKASLKLADLALEVHDEKLAEELFGTALKNGCNDAAVSLGYMYFKKGVDHKVNYLKAVELFKKPNLAASKHAQAELMLCVMYKNGLGVKQSDSKFREHLEKFLKIYSATPALTQDQKKLLYTIYKDYAVYDHIEKIKKDDLDAFLALELRSFGMQFLHKNKQNAEQEYVKQQLEALTGSQNISHVALPALAKLISFKYFEQKMDCPSIMKYFSRMLNCVKTNPTPDNKDALLSYAKSIMRKINSLCEKNQTAIKQAHDYVQMIRELCISLSLDDNQLNDLLNVLKHITFTITDENEEPET